jgi:hypothetical protein
MSERLTFEEAQMEARRCLMDNSTESVKESDNQYVFTFFGGLEVSYHTPDSEDPYWCVSSFAGCASDAALPEAIASYNADVRRNVSMGHGAILPVPERKKIEGFKEAFEHLKACFPDSPVLENSQHGYLFLFKLEDVYAEWNSRASYLSESPWRIGRRGMQYGYGNTVPEAVADFNNTAQRNAEELLSKKITNCIGVTDGYTDV